MKTTPKQKPVKPRKVTFVVGPNGRPMATTPKLLLDLSPASCAARVEAVAKAIAHEDTQWDGWNSKALALASLRAVSPALVKGCE